MVLQSYWKYRERLLLGSLFSLLTILHHGVVVVVYASPSGAVCIGHVRFDSGCNEIERVEASQATLQRYNGDPVHLIRTDKTKCWHLGTIGRDPVFGTQLTIQPDFAPGSFAEHLKADPNECPPDIRVTRLDACIGPCPRPSWRRLGAPATNASSEIEDPLTEATMSLRPHHDAYQRYEQRCGHVEYTLSVAVARAHLYGIATPTLTHQQTPDASKAVDTTTGDHQACPSFVTGAAFHMEAMLGGRSTSDGEGDTTLSTDGDDADAAALDSLSTSSSSSSSSTASAGPYTKDLKLIVDESKAFAFLGNQEDRYQLPGTFKLSELARAHENVDPASQSALQTYHVVELNCADFLLRLAEELQVSFHDHAPALTAFVTRRLVQDAGASLAAKIRNSWKNYESVITSAAFSAKTTTAAAAAAAAGEAGDANSRDLLQEDNDADSSAERSTAASDEFVIEALVEKRISEYSF